MQSDNASNYRDPTTEIDCRFIGTRVFSVEGMGKGEGDANGANVKGKLKRLRDEGNGIESASDLLALGNQMNLKGQTHAKLQLQRGNEDSGIKGRDPVSRNFGMWSIDEEEITFWESLDVEASKESLNTTGRAVGYGPGVKMTIADFNEKQRTQLAPTGATLEMADGSASAPPNPKGRLGRHEKTEKIRDAEAKKAAATAVAAEKIEAQKAREEASFARDIDECARCKTRFLTKGNYIRHLRRWCISRDEAREQRKRFRDVPTILKTMDALAIEQRKRRIDGLSTVVVTLRAPRYETATVGIAVREDPDAGVVIDTVAGLARTSAAVSEEFIVVGVTGSSGDGTLLFSLAVLIFISLDRPRSRPPRRLDYCTRGSACCWRLSCSEHEKASPSDSSPRECTQRHSHGNKVYNAPAPGEVARGARFQRRPGANAAV
jgi:hypothetical protein